MFKDLENLFDDLDDERNNNHANNQLIFIKNFKIDGSFILHHFISYGLKNSSTTTTFFLNSSQTFSHYRSVQAKLGNGQLLSKQLEVGQFIHFDFMKWFESSSLDSNKPKSSFKDDFLNFISTKLASTPQQSKERRRLLFIIEDLSIFDLLGVMSSKDVIGMIRALQEKKINNNDDEAKNILVINTQNFNNSYATLNDHEFTNNYFLNELKHLADISVDVNHLSTGYSKDINGQLRVVKRKHYPIENNEEKNFLFKITERNVQLQPL
jgi:hypothetical protein